MRASLRQSGVFHFQELNGTDKSAPNKHALGLHSKGSAAKTRLLRPRKKFARSGARFSLTRSKGSATPTGNEFSKTGFILKAPQPKRRCYPLPTVRAIRRSLSLTPLQ